MAIQYDASREEQDRKEYLEDLAIEREDDRLNKEHEIRVLKLTQGTAARYKTVEKLGMTLVKLIPYCFAIVGLTTLSLAKRKIPSSIENFLTS